MNSPIDTSALLSRSLQQGGLLLTESELGAAFFDLSNGVAGELMQKFTNYQQRLAIVLNDPTKQSEALQALVREHGKHSLIRFVNSEEAGREWLNYQEKKHD